MRIKTCNNRAKRRFKRWWVFDKSTGDYYPRTVTLQEARQLGLAP